MDVIGRIKSYITKNKTIISVVITALVTSFAIYRYSGTNIVFISTPDNVKLQILEDLDAPDTANTYEINFKPSIPKYLVIHITDNQNGRDLYYDYFHHLFFNEYGWGKFGYHKAVNFNGSVVNLIDVNINKYLEWSEIAYSVKGFNSVSIAVAIVGGKTQGKQGCDLNLSFMQKIQLMNTITYYRSIWPNLKIRGHRDMPGVKKACPCFDIRDWLKKNTTIDPL